MFSVILFWTGLNWTELTSSHFAGASGAHTIGIAHCPSIHDRLYNFSGKGDQDPSMDSFYAINLKQNKCKSSNDNTTIIEMDPGSFRTFDVGYYRNVLKRRGLFGSDAALMTNEATREAVTSLVEGPPERFFSQFALSMERMGSTQVKTGSSGEIRKNCAVLNSSWEINAVKKRLNEWINYLLWSYRVWNFCKR